MWWNDYSYWPMPWAFMPLMMFLFMAMCGAMMFFMMRRMGGHGPRKSTIQLSESTSSRQPICSGTYRPGPCAHL